MNGLRIRRLGSIAEKDPHARALEDAHRSRQDFLQALPRIGSAEAFRTRFRLPALLRKS
jgi:hypothetical protein